MSELDYRGRPVTLNEDGKRILHQPIKTIDQCFEVENISWSIPAISKQNGNPLDIITASADRERQVRKSGQYIFE